MVTMTTGINVTKQKLQYNIVAEGASTMQLLQ